MAELVVIGVAMGVGGAFGGKLLEALEAKKAEKAERNRMEQKRKAFAMACEDFEKDQKQIS